MVNKVYHSKTSKEKEFLEKNIERFLAYYIFNPRNFSIHISDISNVEEEIIEIKGENIEEIVATGKPSARLEKLNFKGNCSLRLNNITYIIKSG